MGKPEKRHNELYVSVDIEADGPIPGINSMLSFGAVAMRGGELIGAYYANLLPLANGVQDPKTMKFWQEHQPAWDHIHSNPAHPQRSPAVVMREFAEWLKSFNKRSIFVGYPASYDFMFVYWYLMAFVNESPFGFSALDIKSYAMSELGTTFRETAKRNMPRHWFKPGLQHTHCALDDALEQACLWLNILGYDTASIDTSCADTLR